MAAILEKLLALQAGAKILDMPCGHGRHAVELVKRGYNVTGVDLNRFFLQKAKEAAAKEGVALDLKKGDMRKRSFDAEFDVALNLFTAIGYFEDDVHDQKVLENFSRSLKSAVLHRFHQSRSHDAQLPPPGLATTPRWLDASYQTQARHADRENIERRIAIPEGNDPRRIIEMICRMYTPVELIKMGAAAGLRFKEAYADFEGCELSIESKRVLLVFEKP
jgi:SAM-dependent methyltransferase